MLTRFIWLPRDQYFGDFSRGNSPESTDDKKKTTAKR